MKEKIQILILIIVFIGILVGINMILNKQNSQENKNITLNTQNTNLEENSSFVMEVTETNFEQEVLKSEKTVLVDFYADWCNPCKILSPIVEEVAKENENIKVVKINVDNAPNLSSEYGTYSIPTLIVIKNGEEVNRAVGVISKEEILSLVNN